MGCQFELLKLFGENSSIQKSLLLDNSKKMKYVLKDPKLEDAFMKTRTNKDE